MANRPGGVLYVGITNSICRRVEEHKQGLGGQFTKRYGCKLLVWYERHEDIKAAIAREKQLKKWSREGKIKLIETHNPRWENWGEYLNA